MPGYEGIEASSFGRIRSRRRNYQGGPRVLAQRVQRFNGNGKRGTAYRRLIINIWDVTRQRLATHGAHQLVCAAFHGVRPDGLETLHIDGDALNNHADNLRWGTKSENAFDTVRHGHHNRQQTGA